MASNKPASNQKPRRSRSAAPVNLVLRAYDALFEATKPYCAHLICGAYDVICALSVGSDPTGMIGNYDIDLAGEAGFVRDIRTAIDHFRNDAKRFPRARRSLADMEIEATGLLAASLTQELNGVPGNAVHDILLKLDDMIEAITLGADRTLNKRSADRLDTLLAVNFNDAERRCLISVWRDLSDFCEIAERARFADMEERAYLEVPDETVASADIIRSVRTFSKNEKIFCSVLQNSLIFAIMQKAGDRITLVEEKLREAGAREDLIDTLLEQIGECMDADGKMPPLDKLGHPIRAGYDLAVLFRETFNTLFTDFEASEDEEPVAVRTALAFLYTALVFLYETDDVGLEAMVDRDDNLSEPVKFAVSCAKALLGVMEPINRTTNYKESFDAEAVIGYLKKTLSPGDYGLTVYGFCAVSEILNAIYGRRQWVRDVEAHLLKRDREYFNGITESVWPIHRLADEFRRFAKDADTEAMNAVLPHTRVTAAQLNKHLMPHAKAVADALVKLPVFCGKTTMGITCQNDIMRTLGRMDDNQHIRILEEMEPEREMAMMNDLFATFLSLVAHQLHLHPQFDPTCSRN